MLPTKKVLEQHLLNKMTNKDIAKIYGTSFQRIIQLIKDYNLNPNKLRKSEIYIVYEHWLDNKVVYVGSGGWYRARRYSNRRNAEHQQLMKEGKIQYKIIAEFDLEEDARIYERKLIRMYKEIGQAKFNKQVH